ncbi:hypothetical protein N658DRAFT_496886 [Parathielavia hyrcaniae]|uniref:Uncharacterized protein n=1 Tax=Parathielavia hyrcaniae TaxID=113614 RepID=A0AAN6T1N7_9PEZI|nr:hypothetical protein N658DRAFT_496886 [Parathielavia hyrcaniae]
MITRVQPDRRDELRWIPASLRKRFYEPTVLLAALRAIYLKDNTTSQSEPDLDGDSGKSPQQTYFCFLNKLSQICDSESKQPLGKTVSAVVVLDSGTIEYRFASNQRDSRELDTVKEYLTAILDVLGRVSDDKVNNRVFMGPIFSAILKKVLAFNRPRMEDYMRALSDRLDFCISSSAADGTSQGASASKALRTLQPPLEVARNAPRLSNDEFARHSEQLLQNINSHYESSLEEYVKTKMQGQNTLADSPWSEVRHALGRLLSYYIAIKVLISARKFWPRLFVDFTVATIPSSAPLSKPPDIRRNAKGIIRRMSRSKATVEAYRRQADHLQGHGDLDQRIRERADPARFRPIVHAEVNLLASVLRDQAEADRDGDGPVRFFHQAEFGAYVGSSKPTCLLCSMYFDAHPSRVGCRKTHGNLYYNWRTPDVVPLPAGPENREMEDWEDEEGGGGGGEARLQRDILEQMVKKIRMETDRAITERTYPRRKHDSWDTPSNPLRSTTVGGSWVAGSLDGASMKGWSEEIREATVESAGEDDGSNLAERMGQVSLDGAGARRRDDRASGVRRTIPDLSLARKGDAGLGGLAPKTVSAARPDSEDDDDDDDDNNNGGGARL